jgi:HAMP domain-containing protein
MGISLMRIAVLSIGLTLLALALALSSSLAQEISNFLAFAHDIAAYPGYIGFP